MYGLNLGLTSHIKAEQETLINCGNISFSLKSLRFGGDCCSEILQLRQRRLLGHSEADLHRCGRSLGVVSWRNSWLIITHNYGAGHFILKKRRGGQLK